jgi:hypothetical protein
MVEDSRSSTALARRPVWMSLPGFLFAFGFQAAAVAVAISGEGPVWQRVALAVIIGFLGCCLEAWALLRPGIWSVSAEGLRVRSILGGKRYDLDQLKGVKERIEGRNFVGTVRVLILRKKGGGTIRIESLMQGYFELRRWLISQGLLARAESPAPGELSEHFEIRPKGQAWAGFLLMTAFLTGGIAACGWGAWVFSWWGRLALLPFLMSGLFMLGVVLVSMAELMITLSVDGERLRRKTWFGRREIPASELDRAHERFQWNGGDRLLSLRLQTGQLWKVDSVCSHYAILLAWLRKYQVKLHSQADEDLGT